MGPTVQVEAENRGVRVDNWSAKVYCYLSGQGLGSPAADAIWIGEGFSCRKKCHFVLLYQAQVCWGFD